MNSRPQLIDIVTVLQNCGKMSCSVKLPTQESNLLIAFLQMSLILHTNPGNQLLTWNANDGKCRDGLCPSS